MSKSTTVITKKRRGPAPTGKGTLVGLRLHADLLDPLDAYMTREGYKSRPEAVREALKDYFIGLGMLKP